MAGSEHDEDDSVLDPSEQLNRPSDTAINQQRIPAWHPILDPVWVIVALFYLGVIMVPTGLKMQAINDNIVEMQLMYDAWDIDPANLTCPIGNNYNADKECLITFTVPKYMSPPIFIHYSISNFHQNHRSYYQSKDPYQLLGKVGGQTKKDADNCKPVNKLGNITINPCGLIANTFFNDVFALVAGRDASGQPLEMIETGIAWESDLEYLYAQPDGFKYEPCPQKTCDASCCAGSQWSCTVPYRDGYGTCYRYFYPDDNNTQYLYETYPNIVSPIEGVTNEHFVVWMRVAAQPNFRKLYGWINQPIPEGEIIAFRINANYAVERFHGSKTLIVSTTSIFGGKNPYLAPVFVGVGAFCLLMGTFFALKHTLRPRRLADRAYLSYKDD